MYGAKHILKSSKNCLSKLGIFLFVFIKELHGGVHGHKYPRVMKLTVTTRKFANTPKNV
jgi:hypothetical protein